MPTALMKRIAKENAQMSGQLVPLKERRTPAQMQKRETKMKARTTAHAMLVGQQKMFMASVGGALNSFFGRGFFGRMKWLAVRR